MKIIFEHEDRKTTVIGTDYDSIVDKIKLLFPNENHRSIQFYDTELGDYFEFTSFEQISDLSNGVKMHFDMSNTSNLFIADHSLPSSLNNGKNDEKNNHVTPKAQLRRIRKKNKLNLINDEPIVLPTYCDLITQGLKSRESFSSIQKTFLEQTCTHFLRQYWNSSSKSLHYSFVLALTEKFPALNYLDKNIDGKNGRAPHKRNIKCSKTHPTPKRSRLSTINSNAYEKTNEELVSEQAPQKDDEFVATVQADDNNLLNQTSLNGLYELLHESSVTKPPTALPDPSKQTTARLPPPKTPIRPPTSSKNDRQATISLVPPSNPSSVNVSSIDTTSISSKLPLITSTPTALIYRDGRMHLTSVQSQPVVVIHKAILPRDPVKKQKQNETHNSTLPTTTINEATNNVLRQSSMDNTEQLKNSTSDEIWYPKLSRSEQNAYEKDISRLRSIVKPKGKSNKLCSFEELQDEAREILNDIIQKYSVQKQHQMSEVDFMAIKILCEDLREQNIFFKYGLPDPHPTIGILIMPSSTKEFEKAFMFIRNLPYKMPVSLGGGGLHQIINFNCRYYLGSGIFEEDNFQHHFKGSCEFSLS
ncbi:unnamed protein product [Rotaria sp. Silwood1]|nr:unnamed protein product [Rotaria sp. Silwood1]